jgi:nucleotide-binding universal stress UspA family protein
VAAFAFREAELHKVPLLAVCALADAPGVLGGAREMEAAFSRAIALLEKEHPDVTVLRHVAQGLPRTALLTAASEAQLLVVGCRGLGGVHGMSLGSVAQAMLHHAPCPVAVIRPPAGG